MKTYNVVDKDTNEYLTTCPNKREARIWAEKLNGKVVEDVLVK